ncbi:MAG: tetratricopeptide repeat protein [Asgard group archaeon]|nr:tetratricopeptide repeat protein [Asgard group archaeon]
MTIDNALELFKQGKFEDAEVRYKEILANEPDNFEAIKQLGKIALYSNKFSEAEKLLTKAILLNSDDKEPHLLLAEVYYRQDKYLEAATILNRIDEKDRAKRLESFKGSIPYYIEEKTNINRIKFVKTDPLPLIQLRVNDGEVAHFVIDTGAAEVNIDTEFAKEIGAEIHFAREGSFAGGKTASVHMGKIDSLTLGEVTIKNVPVNILPVRQFTAPMFRDIRVDGIIGTALFYHFITTMDYLNGELILRKKNDAMINKFEQEIKNQDIAEIPFWMAGKHFMVAWGKANNSKPLLFFVDTGLAGGGFTCPESTIKEAGIELQSDKAITGSGGGGKLQAIPFIVDELSLGNVVEKNIRGFFAGGKTLSEMVGFHIGGIISHGFFRNYALTFDFTKMRLILQKKP